MSERAERLAEAQARFDAVAALRPAYERVFRPDPKPQKKGRK